MKKLLLAFAGMVGALAAAPAMAQTQVNCPLTTANRSISDTLPAGWAQIPYAQRLTNTRITESGVLQTLICEYGEAGNIQRAAPADNRCTARNGGFTCVGTIITVQKPNTVILAPQVVLHRFGTIMLEAPPPATGRNLDFDQMGTQDTSRSTGADIASIVSTDRGWRYDLGSGTKIWLHRGTTPQGKDRCIAAESSYVSSLYNPTLPPAGQYACYKTNGGRFGEFRVTAYGETPGGVKTVTINYATW